MQARLSKTILRRCAGIIILLVALSLLARFYAVWYIDRPGAYDQQVTIMIEKGTGLRQIAYHLEQAGVIDDRRLFIWLLVWRNEAHLLKSGEYALPAYASLDRIRDILIHGTPISHRITFGEGMSMAAMLAKIARDPRFSGKIAHKPVEGALKPDTYFFSRNTKRQDFLHRLQKAQDGVLARLWPLRKADIPLKTPREALILASIIEAETAKQEERGKIAAVFLNRLQKNMPLQSDPTVIYAITRGEKPLGRALRKADLKIQDAYNTYRNRGLPPGAIGNPGEKAIHAALNPQASNALFFVADGKGGHLFARTYADHLQNVRLWRQIQKKTQ